MLGISGQLVIFCRESSFLFLIAQGSFSTTYLLTSTDEELCPECPEQATYTISQLARHQKISLSIQRKAFQLI